MSPSGRLVDLFVITYYIWDGEKCSRKMKLPSSAAVFEVIFNVDAL